jgi:hypothetical protein
MGTWLWYFRKWRVEEGKAIPDPVYLESHRGTRFAGKPGTIITPQGAFPLEEFLSNLLGKPIGSIGRDPTTIEDGELDTEIANFSASTVAAMVDFLANEGIHLRAFVDHTAGLPEFGPYKLQKQGRLLEQLKEALPGWRERDDEPAAESVGLIAGIVRMLEQGYRLGITA